MIILDDNRWTLPTSLVSATSEATALPAVMTQHPERTAVWRSLTQSGVQALDCDLGSVMSLDTVAVANAKLIMGGTLVLQNRGTGSTPGSAVTVLTIDDLDDETLAVLETFPAISARHVRLLWTNPSSLLDYAECGAIGLGPGFVPVDDPQWGFPMNRLDPSVLTSAPDGQATVTQRRQFASGEWDLRWNTTADLDRLRQWYRRVGTSTPFFASFYEVLDWTSLYMRLTGQRGLTGLAQGIFDVAITWEETR